MPRARITSWFASVARVTVVPPTKTGSSQRDRCDLAGFADVPDHVHEHGGLLLGGELEGEGAARRTGSRPGRGEGVAVGEPQYGAVEVVVQLVALLLDRGDDVLRRGGVVAVPHVGAGEAHRPQRALEIGVGVVGVAEQVEREELQAALGNGRGILRAERAGGGVPRVDQRLVRVGGVVGGERGAQHDRLATHLDPALYVEALGDSIGECPDERRHVVARRTVTAGDCPGELPVLVDERQRQPVQLRHHDDRLTGEAREERLDLLGLGRLLQRQHRPRVPHRRMQYCGRPDLLERIRIGRQLRIRRDQRPQLVLDHVVLRVRHRRRTPVIRIAPLHDPPGKFPNPLPNVHGSGPYRDQPTASESKTSPAASYTSRSPR